MVFKSDLQTLSTVLPSCGGDSSAILSTIIEGEKTTEQLKADVQAKRHYQV